MDASWLDVFGISVQITANLLNASRHFALNDALNFAGTHLKQIATVSKVNCLNLIL